MGLPKQAGGADLRSRRRALTALWADFFSGMGEPDPSLPPEIGASWRRVRTAALPETADAGSAAGSPLADCRRALERSLREVADDTGFLIALAGADARLVAAHAGGRMARAARRLNAVDGTLWSEDAMGTNAVALALGSGRAVEVFTAQHANEVLHDWTCWAFPVRDPRTGTVTGALDVSAPWRDCSGSGVALARTLAALVESRLRELPADRATGSVVEVGALGHPRAVLNGRRLRLSPRQFEILTILALRPEGVGFDALHADLYGDLPVAAVTLRAELSKLRRALGPGVLLSHPYRLAGEVSCDLAEQLDHLARGRLRGALDLQRGESFPTSESPFLRMMREHALVSLRTAVLTVGGSGDLLRYLELFPDDLEVLEHGCARAAPGSPEHALFAGRLRAGPS
ncbi:helix-turn-helix domain-containing protein [Amycolatopsis ultiminotia]|uniref:Helix-turn-helix domain-containing protein n=1 Tax=Amycolatopsis ultiminotia TaxID=543629 RepID=A0ABP6WA33_9PSEU